MDDLTRARLAKLKSECGCNAGLAAFVISVGAYSGYSLWLDPVLRGLGERVIIGFGIALAGMLIGKLLGMGWARYQYRKLFRAQAVQVTG